MSLSVVLVCGRRNVPFWLPSLWDSQCAWKDRSQSVLVEVSVILTPLEKPLLLSNPRLNIIQSVRKRQREMHECAGTLDFTWSFSVLELYHSKHAYTTRPHTLSSQYHIHLVPDSLPVKIDENRSHAFALPRHPSHSLSVCVCVSTEQRCTNVRRNQPIGMLRPGQHWMLRWNSALGTTRPRTSFCS